MSNDEKTTRTDTDEKATRTPTQGSGPGVATPAAQTVVVESNDYVTTCPRCGGKDSKVIPDPAGAKAKPPYRRRQCSCGMLYKVPAAEANHGQAAKKK